MSSDLPTNQRDPERRTRLPRAVREQQMLDVAARCFGQRGFHGISMDDIAEAAGISKPMLYAYFDSKDGLYMACVRRAGKAMVEFVGRETDIEAPPSAQVWQAGLAFYKHIGQNQDDWRLMRRESVWGRSVFSDQLEELRTELGQAIIRRVGAVIRIHDLPIDDKTAYEPFAMAMVGAAEAIAKWWIDQDGVPPEVPARHFMNVTWYGFERMIFGDEVLRSAGESDDAPNLAQGAPTSMASPRTFGEKVKPG